MDIKYTPIPPIQVPNMVPFTHKDGAYYIEVLKALVKYLDTMVDKLNEVNNDWGDTINAAIKEINESVTGVLVEVKAVLAAQTVEVDGKIAALTADVEAAIELLTNNTIEFNDPLVKSIIDDADTETRKALDALYSFGDGDVKTILDEPTSQTRKLADELYLFKPSLVNDMLTGKTETRTILDDLYNHTPASTHKSYIHNGVWVDEYRVSTGGRHYPGLVTRPMAGGTAMPPSNGSLKTVLGLQREHGGALLANGSGWVVVEGVAPSVRGANILNGVAYGELTNRHPQDNACIAYCDDGQLRYYEHALGQRAKDAIADGAIHSWSWGPRLIDNGVLANYMASGGWDALNRVAKSSRTVLGQYANGDIAMFIVYGATGIGGMTVDECGDMLTRKGLRIAVLLDGGGSSCSVWDGVIAHPSSDATSRPVVDTIGFNAPTLGGHNYQSTALSLEAPFTGYINIQSDNGNATIDISVVYAMTTTDQAVLAVKPANLPPWYRNERMMGVVSGGGGNMGTSRTRSGGLYIGKPLGQVLNGADGIATVKTVVGLE